MEDEGKKEEKLEFTTEGEALGYISLEQARVLAIRHARENTDFYGPRYSGTPLVSEVISQEEWEDYYDIRLSFRPAGRFPVSMVPSEMLCQLGHLVLPFLDS